MRRPPPILKPSSGTRTTSSACGIGPIRVHAHGALAGTEIVSNASALANYYSREIPLGPSHTPVTYSPDPVQARAMDLDDIREFRRWHRDGMLRARDAGFDLVYVYCAHDIAMPMDFLSRRRNRRTDEYGGSLENRARLLRELLEDTVEAVGQQHGDRPPLRHRRAPGQ